jgi:hypothetical protein
VVDDPWQRQIQAFGDNTYAQRKLAKLSLRELAAVPAAHHGFLVADDRSSASSSSNWAGAVVGLT